VIHHHALDPVDVMTFEGLPVTTPARTLIDVAAMVDEATLEVALDDALRRGLVSLPRLRWRLEQLTAKGRPGVKPVRSLLEARDHAVPQSVFETRLRRLMRDAGLPQPVGQYPIRVDGRVLAVVDFAFPQAHLAIEADGYRWHSGRVRFDDDLARRNRLTLLGRRIIHVTWTDLTERPTETVEAIGRALRPI
jgi:very-short-patch-repair endonuclease